MCGIIGYIGSQPSVPILLGGLKSLEYRGYDSAGLACQNGGNIEVLRVTGKIANLEEALSLNGFGAAACCGIGHTRWATHGAPEERNAHPHRDNSGKLALVHNGIIENYETLRTELRMEGYVCTSDTDTEVLVNLISKGVRLTGDVEHGIAWALERAEGAYAIVLMHQDHPGVLWGARKSSPMVLGLGKGEYFLASDIPALLQHTRDVVYLDDGEIVRLDRDSWTTMRIEGLSPVTKTPSRITWDIAAAQKGGYSHFMLKEIMEQPRVVTDCLAGRVDWGRKRVVLPELDALPVPERLRIVACGTSFHAGLWAKYLIEKWCRIPVEPQIASEFRYADPILAPGDLALAVSQSGETADTLAGMTLAREASIPVVGLCNVVGSTVSREADATVYTQAGPEISVASTKAMCSQMTLLLLMAVSWADRKGLVTDDLRDTIFHNLRHLAATLEANLGVMRLRAKELARRFAEVESFFYLGRGLDFPLALEGALKLKEISYIHAEGYPAGEMKHGPIALIQHDFPTFTVACSSPELMPKVVSNCIEVKARSGPVIALVPEGTSLDVDQRWEVPNGLGPFGSFLALPALQLFAYEVATHLGRDVDQPRNLAKSVTVE